jgi:hypothetical protein
MGKTNRLLSLIGQRPYMLCVMDAAATSLPSRCLATTLGIFRNRCLEIIKELYIYIFVIPFYLHSVLVHSASYVSTDTQFWPNFLSFSK